MKVVCNRLERWLNKPACLSNLAPGSRFFTNPFQPVVEGINMKDKARRRNHRKHLREKFQRDFKLKRRCQGCLRKTRDLYRFKKGDHKYWICRVCLIKAFNLRLRGVNFSIKKLGSTSIKGKAYIPRRLYGVSMNQKPTVRSPRELAGGKLGGQLDDRARTVKAKAFIGEYPYILAEA